MEYATLTTESIVKAANQGEYAVPEFQRGFVWTIAQVLEFVDSLARNFPVGSILTWKSDTAIQRGDGHEPRQKSWLIDGQQRTTALCTLFGRQPEWWDHNHNGTWTEHLKRYNICLDAGADELAFVARKTTSPRYVPVSNILNTENLFNLAQDLVQEGRTYTQDVGDFAQRLHQIASLKHSILPIVEIDDNIELTDVADIFKRLNSTGTRVQQADIYLGVVASRNPGWVNDNFLTFMYALNNDGFEIEPAFLFRAFTAIGTGKTRFRDIPQAFWSDLNTSKSWESTKKALRSVCQGLREYGIINSDLALSQNAIVAAAVYRDRFHTGAFGPFLAWMLCAIKDEFFSGPTESRLDRFIGIIQGASSRDTAMPDLYRLLDSTPEEDRFTSEEFKGTRHTRSSIQRLMVYLIAFNNNAQDWNSDGYHIQAEAKGPYRPEWHHIFPRKWLRDNREDLDVALIDTVANMAVISGDANRKIAASEPRKYIKELNLANRGLLHQQAVPDPSFVGPEQYVQWLENRSEALAQESNKYLAELRK